MKPFKSHVAKLEKRCVSREAQRWFSYFLKSRYCEDRRTTTQPDCFVVMWPLFLVHRFQFSKETKLTAPLRSAVQPFWAPVTLVSANFSMKCHLFVYQCFRAFYPICWWVVSLDLSSYNNSSVMCLSPILCVCHLCPCNRFPGHHGSVTSFYLLKISRVSRVPCSDQMATPSTRRLRTKARTMNPSSGMMQVSLSL